jgi:hypothetical protein
MELYKQPEDIRVMGNQVKTFPTGIKEAFDSLMKNLGAERPYYGVSWMDDAGTVQYFAMAAETDPGEAIKFGYERMTIEKGDYETEAVYNWQSNLACIKDVFHDLMGDTLSDKSRPCIEWYQSNEKMLCMIRKAT